MHRGLGLWLLLASLTACARSDSPLGMTMRLIPAGDYVKGIDPGHPVVQAHQRDYELLLEYGSALRSQSVRMPSFYLSNTPVTNRQYEQFNPDHLRSDPAWDDDAPVVNVSWFDAVAYCRWLSVEEGRPYRLPTESEWEYAASGGVSGQIYPWGEEFMPGGQAMCHAPSAGGIPFSKRDHQQVLTHLKAGDTIRWKFQTSDLEERAWVLACHDDHLEVLQSHRSWKLCQIRKLFPAHLKQIYSTSLESSVGPRKVALHPANRWGLHDVAGHVWQWVADWHDMVDERSRRHDPMTWQWPESPEHLVDPLGPSQGQAKISKGGSFKNAPPFCTNFVRGYDPPHVKGSHIGFRIALSVEDDGKHQLQMDALKGYQKLDRPRRARGASDPDRWLGQIIEIDSNKRRCRLKICQRNPLFGLAVELSTRDFKVGADCVILSDDQRIDLDKISLGALVQAHVKKNGDHMVAYKILTKG